MKASGPGWLLYLGRWQQELASVEIDDRVAVITDPPYSARTHRGQRSGAARRGAGYVAPPANRIDYDEIAPADVAALVERFAGAGWLIAFGDHYSTAWFEAAALESDRYVFAPVVWCKPDAAPRMQGDGPPSAIEHVHVSRLRSRAVIQRLQGQPSGFYTMGRTRSTQAVVGAKPLALMRAIVREYTQPGDLVVDPFAGGGTTLLAAAIEGRRAIGCEADADTFEAAADRLRAGFTRSLFERTTQSKARQGAMFDGE